MLNFQRIGKKQFILKLILGHKMLTKWSTNVECSESSAKSDKAFSSVNHVQKWSSVVACAMKVEVNLRKLIYISNFTFPKDFLKIFPKSFPKNTFPKCRNISKTASKKFGIVSFQLISTYSWLEVFKQLVIYAYALQPIYRYYFRSLRLKRRVLI